MIPAWLSLIVVASQPAAVAGGGGEFGGGGGGGPTGGCGIPGFGNLQYWLPPQNARFCANTLISSDGGSTNNPQPIPYGTVSTGGMLYEHDVIHIQVAAGVNCNTGTCTLQNLTVTGAGVNYTQITSWGETQNAGLNLGSLWKILTGSTFGVNKSSSTACSIAVTIPPVVAVVNPGNTVVYGYVVPTQTMLEVQQTSTCIGTRTSIVTLLPTMFGAVTQYGMLYDSCANTWSGTGCTNNTMTPCSVTSVSSTAN